MKPAQTVMTRRSMIGGLFAAFAAPAHATTKQDINAAVHRALQENDSLEPHVFSYNGPETPGTILVRAQYDSPKQSKLYLVGNGKIYQYPIAIAKNESDMLPDHTTFMVGARAWWPTYRPTKSARQRNPKARSCYNGGPNNPHGVAKLYFYKPGYDESGNLVPLEGNYTVYGGHGTDDESTIGKNASGGCFRLMNTHMHDVMQRLDDLKTEHGIKYPLVRAERTTQPPEGIIGHGEINDNIAPSSSFPGPSYYKHC